MMNKNLRPVGVALLTAAVALSSVVIAFRPRPDQDRSPAEKRGEGVPPEWTDRINRTASGDVWKEIEAASLRDLVESRRLKSGPDSLDVNWSERGPSDVPGRITDMEIDYDSGSIYCLSDHGLVFRGDLQGRNWQSLNDQHPLALGVACFLGIVRLPDHIRIIVAGWQKTLDGWGVFISDDQGATWQKPAGLFQYPVTGIRRGKVTRDGVFLFVQEYHSQKSTDYYTVYKSDDYASSFKPLYRSKIRPGDGNRNTKSDLWMSGRPGDTNLFLALEDSLFTVDSRTGERSFKSLISGISGLNGLLLTGASLSEPARLRAWIGDNGTARYFASDDGGITWMHRGDFTDGVATYPFGYNSFAASARTADTLYFGGVLAIRSTDAGKTWRFPDMDPTNSYALYHGDVPKIYMPLDPRGVQEVYFGTDGGMYRRDDAHDHMVTLSVPGLNTTQIYKMSSMYREPGKMFAGTQDNGYIRTLTGSDGKTPAGFSMIWGGDVTNIASGDEGRTFWVWWWGEGCNYVTVPETDYTVSNYSPSWSNLECPYWEAPIWVSSWFPDQCLTAGKTRGGSGSYLIRIRARKNEAARAEKYGFNFQQAAGDLVTAMAISPVDSSHWYVATANGYFFRSSDAGRTWSAKKLLSSGLYVRAIFPSRISLGNIWVGGSGYSNSAVYHSTDNGVTFKAVNTGLPKTIVEAFDANPDESLLFAATGVAPLMLRTSTGEWTDIAGTKAPLVHYMDVEYIPGIAAARFATYARGIWDFSVPKSLNAGKHELASGIRVYPVPARDRLWIDLPGEPGKSLRIQLFSTDGRLLTEQIGVTGIQAVDVSSFDRGVYVVRIMDGPVNQLCKIVLH